MSLKEERRGSKSRVVSKEEHVVMQEDGAVVRARAVRELERRVT